MSDWEEIDVPRGAYIGWGATPGQHVTGIVRDYSVDGGTDFNEKPCPQLEVELTEPAASFNKAGERTDIEAGETVQLSCGQVSLKRAVRAANPAAGDEIKVKLTQLVKVPKGQVKEFGIQIKRGAAPVSVPAAAAADDPWGAGGDQPPF